MLDKTVVDNIINQFVDRNIGVLANMERENPALVKAVDATLNYLSKKFGTGTISAMQMPVISYRFSFGDRIVSKTGTLRTLVYLDKLYAVKETDILKEQGLDEIDYGALDEQIENKKVDLIKRNPALLKAKLSQLIADNLPVYMTAFIVAAKKVCFYTVEIDKAKTQALQNEYAANDYAITITQFGYSEKKIETTLSLLENVIDEGSQSPIQVLDFPSSSEWNRRINNDFKLIEPEGWSIGQTFRAKTNKLFTTYNINVDGINEVSCTTISKGETEAKRETLDVAMVNAFVKNGDFVWEQIPVGYEVGTVFYRDKNGPKQLHKIVSIEDGRVYIVDEDGQAIDYAISLVNNAFKTEKWIKTNEPFNSLYEPKGWKLGDSFMLVNDLNNIYTVSTIDKSTGEVKLAIALSDNFLNSTISELNGLFERGEANMVVNTRQSKTQSNGKWEAGTLFRISTSLDDIENYYKIWEVNSDAGTVKITGVYPYNTSEDIIDIQTVNDDFESGEYVEVQQHELPKVLSWEQGDILRISGKPNDIYLLPFDNNIGLTMADTIYYNSYENGNLKVSEQSYATLQSLFMQGAVTVLKQSALPTDVSDAFFGKPSFKAAKAPSKKTGGVKAKKETVKKKIVEKDLDEIDIDDIEI